MKTVEQSETINKRICEDIRNYKMKMLEETPNNGTSKENTWHWH